MNVLVGMVDFVRNNLLAGLLISVFAIFYERVVTLIFPSVFSFLAFVGEIVMLLSTIPPFSSSLLVHLYEWSDSTVSTS